MTLDETAEAVETFFTNQLSASLILPSGWFGRPHDNMHKMTECIATAEILRVELDGQQVLSFEGTALSWRAVTMDGAQGLRIRGFAGLDWDWCEYGSCRPRHRRFTEGDVTFVSPPDVVSPAFSRPTHES